MTNDQQAVDVTTEAMKSYLAAIGFVLFAEMDHAVVFRHGTTGSVVTLGTHDDSRFVRSADFLSIRFRLETEGLVSEDAILKLKQGQLPIAS